MSKCCQNSLTTSSIFYGNLTNKCVNSKYLVYFEENYVITFIQHSPSLTDLYYEDISTVFSNDI